jgi:mannose-1-phosphate guanylyltransferase
LVLGNQFGILTKINDYQNNIQGEGEIIVHNVQDSYINSDAQKTIAIDLKNMVIIFKNGQLLVSDKNSAEFVKQVMTDPI